MIHTKKVLAQRPMVTILLAYALILLLLLGLYPEKGERLFGYRAREEAMIKWLERDGQGERASVKGTITQKRALSYGYWYVMWVTPSGMREAGNESFPCRGWIVCRSREEWTEGDTVVLKGKVSFPERATNPGQWDEREYALEQGYLLTIRSEAANVIKHGPIPIVFFFAWSRDAVLNKIRQLWPLKDQGIIAAMVLGEKSLLDPEEKALFQQGGISHIIAISGLHMAILSEILLKILERLLGNRRGEMVTVILLWMYAVWTGGAIATLRAALMFTVRMMGKRVGREYDFYSCYAFSALVLLIMHPIRIRSAAFWMSFGALLGMQVGESILIHARRIPYLFRKKMASSFGVTLVTLPLSLWFFSEASPLSFLLNLYVVPSVTILFSFSLLALSFGSISPILSSGFIKVTSWLLRSYEAGSRVIGKLNFLSFRGRPSILQVLILGLLILLCIWIFSGKEKRMRLGYRILAGVLLLTLLLPGPRRVVTFLDVGQGDCAVIEWQGTVMVVDAGPSYDTVIRPYLMQEGIRTIDVLILSHPDQDHMEGAMLLAEDPSFQIRHLWIAKAPVQETLERDELIALIKAGGGEVSELEKGDHGKISGITFQVLSPGSSWESVNDASLVVKLAMGGDTFLFAGDISQQAESWILQEWDELDLQVNVLKTPHHGSGSSSSESFLHALGAELAVISCGRQNSYGHPHPETLERMEEAGISYLVTARSGCIQVEKLRNKWRIRTFLDP